MTKEIELNEQVTLELPMDIDALLEENGGELTPEIEAEYDRLHGDDFPKIVEAKVRSIKRFEAMAKGLKAEAASMSAEGQRKAGAADQMRRGLVAEMGIKGQRKVITGPWTVSLAKKPPRITLKEDTDLKDIESTLKRHVPEKWELDKMAVRESLKSRNLIPTEIGVWTVEDFDVEISERLNIR